MNKISPKVSILIPCYNVEKYINQCLESVIHQTVKNIEIICINDGSTDKTLSILKSYQEKDRRIKIIDKSNSGYGASMNAGLRQATGEYIGIVESDDFAELNMFETLYNLANNQHVDIVKGNFFGYISSTNTNTIIKNIPVQYYNKKFNPIKNLESFLPAPAIWSAIYKRDFLVKNDIYFLETPGASYQDTSFNFKALLCTNNVYYTDKAFLHYRQDNENSSVNSPQKVFCICDEFKEMERFAHANPEKYEKIKTYFPTLKFAAYSWNFNRLKFPLNLKFLKVFSKEFRGYKKSGLLQEQLWKRGGWRNLNRLLKSPLFFYIYNLLKGGTKCRN